MALAAMTGAAFDREPCLGQRAADMACGGIGGESAMGGGVAGDL